jgi:copper homeostasis protein
LQTDMPDSPVIEVCVESVDRAAAAERGGADRIELCQDLHSGGITPDAELMQATRNHIRVPIHVLVRPRSGDFVYSDAEFETMKHQIRTAKELNMDGIVLGLLDEHRQIDQRRTSILVRLAHPLPVTFHRAFDLCQSLIDSLPGVIDTGAKRILSSGGKACASDGLGCLADLVAAAGDRITIMPGGGIRANNIRSILRETGAREVHTSVGTADQEPTFGPFEPKVVPHTLRNRKVANFEGRVRNLRRLVQSVSYGTRPTVE